MTKRWSATAILAGRALTLMTKVIQDWILLIFTSLLWSGLFICRSIICCHDNSPTYLLLASASVRLSSSSYASSTSGEKQVGPPGSERSAEVSLSSGLEWWRNRRGSWLGWAVGVGRVCIEFAYVVYQLNCVMQTLFRPHFTGVFISQKGKKLFYRSSTLNVEEGFKFVSPLLKQQP